jgi:ubiquinone/menaquinone biosynthesis C-methylase UbiE
MAKSGKKYNILVKPLFSYDFYIKLQFWPYGGEEKFRHDMMKEIEFSSKDNILDMGCGTGGSTFAIRKNAGGKSKIIGIDLLQKRIIKANNKNEFGNVKFFIKDITNTAFDNIYFDKVFISYVLHEMMKTERLKVLLEAKRLLNENGKLIVMEEEEPKNLKTHFLLGLQFGNWWPSSIKFEYHTRRDMIKQGIVNEIKEVGFKHIKKNSKFNGLMQIIIAEK